MLVCMYACMYVCMYALIAHVAAAGVYAVWALVFGVLKSMFGVGGFGFELAASMCLGVYTYI